MSFDLSAFRLDGRTALVIGGNRGIGLGIAQALHAAGARIALAARSVESLEQAAQALGSEGAEASAFPVDIRSVAAVQGLVRDVHGSFGRLDILVNSAGVNVRKPADEISEDEWNGLFEINVRGMFFACQAAARVMRAQGGGCILNVGSGSDLLTVSNIAPYAISKAGVRQLTRSLAAEWADRRHPRQRGRAGARANRDDRGGVRRSGQARRARQGDPTGPARVVPADLAGTAFLLVSDAGAYITGQTLSVDGGWNLGLVGA